MSIVPCLATLQALATGTAMENMITTLHNHRIHNYTLQKQQF